MEKVEWCCWCVVSCGCEETEHWHEVGTWVAWLLAGMAVGGGREGSILSWSPAHQDHSSPSTQCLTSSQHSTTGHWHHTATPHTWSPPEHWPVPPWSWSVWCTGHDQMLAQPLLGSWWSQGREGRMLVPWAGAVPWAVARSPLQCEDGCWPCSSSAVDTANHGAQAGLHTVNTGHMPTYQQLTTTYAAQPGDNQYPLTAKRKEIAQMVLSLFLK